MSKRGRKRAFYFAGLAVLVILVAVFFWFEGERVNSNAILAQSENLLTQPGNITDNYSDINYSSDVVQGSYIIEFKQDPILKKASLSLKLGKTLSISDVKFASSQYALIKKEHQNAINDINSRVKCESSLTGKIIYKIPIVDYLIRSITGKAIDNFVNPIKPSSEYFNVIDGIAVYNLSSEEVGMIEKSPYVQKVYPNMRVSIILMDAVPLIGADRAWSYDSNMSLCNVTGKQCLTGKGIKVAIIDTGVDYNHSDLGGCFGNGCRVAGGYDFINNDSDPMDDNGHGTHVAGIIGANGALKGVAPDVTLYAYKALDVNGSGTWDEILEGIERAIDPNNDQNFSDKVDIISMSFGGSGNPDDVMSQAVDNVVDAGVTVVVAAGNSGPNPSTVKSPGSARKAITVGATYKQNYTGRFWSDNNPRIDRVTSFSSRGPVIWSQNYLTYGNLNPDIELIDLFSNDTSFYTVKPDVVAPGALICSTLLPGYQPWNSSAAYQKCFDDNHVLLAGTSMAAPMVSGVVALMKQAHPDWTPEDMKNALRSTAENLNVSINMQGYGRVNALKAVQAQRPEKAELYAPGRVSGRFNIIANVSQNVTLTNISLAYGLIDQLYWNSLSSGQGVDLAMWNEIPLSGAGLNNGVLIKNLNSYFIPNGNYILRLRVFGANNFSEDREIMTVYNKNIISNVGYDIYEDDKSIPIYLNLSLLGDKYANLSNYALEYALNKNKSIVGDWKTDGLLLCSPTTGKEGFNYKTASSTLCSAGSINESEFLWDVSLVNGSGMYSLRLNVNYNGTIGEDRSDFIYIDHSLRSGWPQHVNYPNVTYPAGNWMGFVNPVVYDINGDGKKEIIMHIGRDCYGLCDDPYDTIRAYNPNGTIYWETALGKEFLTNISGGYSTLLAPPVIGDIDNDGHPEIIEYLTDWKNLTGLLYALNYTGGVKSGWPIAVPFDYSGPSIMAIDIDNDGYDEIIGQGRSQDSQRGADVFVVKNGSIAKNWTLPNNVMGNTIYSPAVGDLNGDGKKEIVIGTNAINQGGLLIAYDSSGNMLWESQLDGSFEWHSSPSTADMNNDGKDEIIVAVFVDDGVHSGFQLEVYNGDGSRMENFSSSPLFVTLSNGLNLSTWTEDSIALEDLNGDGKKEIVFSARTNLLGDPGFYATFVLYNNGSVMPGWPQMISHFMGAWSTQSRHGPTIADVNGDGNLDILTTGDTAFPIFGGNYDYFPYINFSSEGSGVWAWNLNGSLIAGFPHGTQFLPDVSPIIADLDGDGKLELIASSYYDMYPFYAGNLMPYYLMGRASIYVWQLNVTLPTRYSLTSYRLNDQWLSYRKDAGQTACASCDNLEFSGRIMSNVTQNIYSNFTLERPNQISVQFNSDLNLSRIENNISLLSNIRITKNAVSINDSILPEFNTSAQITFKNVNFVIPKVRYNGGDCPTDVCTNISFNNSDSKLVVDVTHLSTFEVVESYVSPESSGSGGSSVGSLAGGGSGAGPLANYNNPNNPAPNENQTITIVNESGENTVPGNPKSSLLQPLVIILAVIMLAIVAVLILILKLIWSKKPDAHVLLIIENVESMIEEGMVFIDVNDIEKARKRYDDAKRLIETNEITDNVLYDKMLIFYQKIAGYQEKKPDSF